MERGGRQRLYVTRQVLNSSPQACPLPPATQCKSRHYTQILLGRNVRLSSLYDTSGRQYMTLLGVTHGFFRVEAELVCKTF